MQIQLAHGEIGDREAEPVDVGVEHARDGAERRTERARAVEAEARVEHRPVDVDLGVAHVRIAVDRGEVAEVDAVLRRVLDVTREGERHPAWASEAVEARRLERPARGAARCAPTNTSTCSATSRLGHTSTGPRRRGIGVFGGDADAVGGVAEPVERAAQGLAEHATAVTQMSAEMRQ